MREGTLTKKMSIGVLRRDTKLKSLRTGGERSHMRGGQGMLLDIDTEKHLERDKGIGGREGAV